MIDFDLIEGFDWDQGNALKNAKKHGVTTEESEQAFFNEPLIVAVDTLHGVDEPRFNALGKTNAGRLIHVTFTLRNDGKVLRVISARDMSRKERVIYVEEAEKSP